MLLAGVAQNFGPMPREPYLRSLMAAEDELYRPASCPTMRVRQPARQPTPDRFRPD